MRTIMRKYYTIAESSNNEHIKERSVRLDSPETQAARRFFLQKSPASDFGS